MHLLLQYICASFYSNLLADLSSDILSLVILGGDLNTCLEPELDQSPLKSTQPSRMAVVTRELCNDLNLYYTQRILNPKMKDFTFFSRPHNSFSRIDYFFASRQTVDTIKNIQAMTRSDHSCIRMELTPPYYDLSMHHWLLNPSLLSNPTLVTVLEEQLTLLFFY